MLSNIGMVTTGMDALFELNSREVEEVPSGVDLEAAEEEEEDSVAVATLVIEVVVDMVPRQEDLITVSGLPVRCIVLNIAVSFPSILPSMSVHIFVGGIVAQHFCCGQVCWQL